MPDTETDFGPAQKIAALHQRIADLEAALVRVAAYLGVSHLLPQPPI